VNAGQFVEPTRSAEEAFEMVRVLGAQDGCIAARVIGDGAGRRFSAQALFELAETDRPQWLPDGCCQVVVPGGSSPSRCKWRCKST